MTVEPDPSYREDALSVRRHPEVDTNVFLYIRHWRESPPRTAHGGFIERDILTPGNPDHPALKGAVLKYAACYRQAVLQPRTETQLSVEVKEQVFLYFTSGTGRVTSGAKTAAVEEGTAVFIPAGLPFQFINDADVPLEAILVAEEIAPGFVPEKVFSVGDIKSSKPAVGHHWAHIAWEIRYDVPPKFSNPMGFALVGIDAFDIAQPHTHPAGTEEIWCQIKGTSLLFFGNRLLRQEPGEAFLVPPNNKVPHSSINPTNEPMLWLFMGCRK